MVQADFFDPGWDMNWWGDIYFQNVRHRKITVDRDVPVHRGRIRRLDEVAAILKTADDNAELLCERAIAAGFYPTGCPVPL